MKFLKITIYVCSVILALFVSGCDDTITAEDVDKRIIPDSNVSYAQHLRPVFEVHCVSCHNSQRREGNVDLSTWSGVTDPNIVFRGDADASRLVWTVERLPGFAPMPPGYRLIQNQIDGIRTWIDEGAENN